MEFGELKRRKKYMMKGGLGWTANIRNELARLVMRTNNVLLCGWGSYQIACVLVHCSRKSFGKIQSQHYKLHVSLILE